MFSQRQLNIKSICMLGKLLFIKDSVNASHTRIAYTHQNRIMAQLWMSVTYTLDQFIFCVYFFEDECGFELTGVFDVDDVVPLFSLRDSICLTCLEL